MMDKAKKMVLVIDDETEMTHLLKIELEQAGYEVQVAHDGEEGFQRMRESHPSLIILDIMMPGMDGFEMLKILKADDGTKDVPVIVLTAKVHEKDIEKGKSLGAALYITKPFDSVQMVKSIHQIMGEQ